MAKPRNYGAGPFVEIDSRRVSVTDLRARLADRDRRLASDTRTEAQKWLGDPPRSQSALARGQPQSAARRRGARVDLWKK